MKGDRQKSLSLFILKNNVYYLYVYKSTNKVLTNIYFDLKYKYKPNAAAKASGSGLS